MRKLCRSIVGRAAVLAGCSGRFLTGYVRELLHGINAGCGEHGMLSVRAKTFIELQSRAFQTRRRKTSGGHGQTARAPQSKDFKRIA
jgi:hypothetical protein